MTSIEPFVVHSDGARGDLPMLDAARRYGPRLMSLTSILERLAQIITRRPMITLCVTVSIYILLSLLALRIRIDVDFTSMVPQEDPSIKHVFQTMNHFGSLDRVFIAFENTKFNSDEAVASTASLDESQRCVDHLAAIAHGWEWTDPKTGEREQMVPLIKGYHDKAFKEVQSDLLLSRSYMFLDKDNLDNLIKRLHPKYIQARIKRGPSASVPAELRDRDLLGVWNDYLSFWAEQSKSESYIRQKGSYIYSTDERFHVLLLNPRHPGKYMEFCLAMNDRLLSLNDELAKHPQWSHIKLHMVGGYISAANDFKVVKTSLLKTMLSSIIGVVLLFGIAYRSLRLILLIGIGLVPAIAAALGVTTFILGTNLSIVVSAFAAILIGLGVDFIIHLYNSYCWSMAEGDQNRGKAAQRALVRIGPGIIVGCLTSVGTFSVLATSEFKGIFELGVVTSCGLLMVLLSLIIIVPSFLTLWGPRQARQPRGLYGYGDLITRRPLPFGIFTGVLIIAAFVALALNPKIFILDSNLRNLRPYNESYAESLELADTLGIRFGSNKVTLFGEDEEAVLSAGLQFIDNIQPLSKDIPVVAQEAFTLAQLQAKENSLLLDKIPTKKNDLLARYVLGTPWGDCVYERIDDKRVYNLKPIKEIINADQQIAKGDELGIKALFGPMNLNSAMLISPQHQKENLKRLRDEVDWKSIKDTLAQAPDEKREQYDSFFKDMEQMCERVENDQLLLPSELARSPMRGLIDTFYHQEGAEHHFLFALNVRYDRTLIPLEELQKAIGVPLGKDGRPHQKSGVTIGTCGIPTISHYLQKTIVGDFTKLTGIAMALVLVILLIGIRSPIYVLLSMLTLGIGLLFTLSIMRVSNTPWNILNIAVVPLIIGIGIDNSVHFLHCLKHHSFDRNGIRMAIAETGHPIMMTALTSIIGFGSLLFNAYRGIQGIGTLASIGIFACMLAALLGLPLFIIGINQLFGKHEDDDASISSPKLKQTDG